MLFKTVVLNTYFGNTYFLKNPQVSDLMKVHPVLAELFRVGRQTDRHDEANSRVLQFREPARNDCSSYFDITVGPRTAPESAVKIMPLSKIRKARFAVKCQKHTGLLLILYVALQPNSGLGRRIFEIHRSHTIRHTHLVGLL
jgi:hypothetical protein